MTHRRLLLFSLALLLLLAYPAAQQRPDKPAGAEDQRATDEPATPGPGNAAHGRYIVHDIAMCVECHSRRDDQGHIVQGQEFNGAPIPVRPPWPNDWALEAPRNRGLPGYTPEMGVRLLTQGAIGRDGRQLQPPMPRFRMTQQDAADVVAFMKSLP